MGKRSGRKSTRRLKIANNPATRPPRVVATGHRRPGGDKMTVGRIDLDAFTQPSVDTVRTSARSDTRVITIIRKPASKGADHAQSRQSAV